MSPCPPFRLLLPRRCRRRSRPIITKACPSFLPLVIIHVFNGGQGRAGGHHTIGAGEGEKNTLPNAPLKSFTIRNPFLCLQAQQNWLPKIDPSYVYAMQPWGRFILDCSNGGIVQRTVHGHNKEHRSPEMCLITFNGE